MSVILISRKNNNIRNPIRNKFDRLSEFTTNEVDVLMISETKLDSLLFSQSQYCMNDSIFDE